MMELALAGAVAAGCNSQGLEARFCLTRPSVTNTHRSQRVHVQELGSAGGPGQPQPLTAEGSKQRFADYALDAARNRLIAVCEDHSQEGQEAVNSIAAIGERVRELVCQSASLSRAWCPTCNPHHTHCITTVQAWMMAASPS
jgi:hypothetical protein